jgi:hypothetical protein
LGTGALVPVFSFCSHSRICFVFSVHGFALQGETMNKNQDALFNRGEGAAPTGHKEIYRWGRRMRETSQHSVASKLVMRTIAKRLVVAVFAATQIDPGFFGDFELNRRKFCMLVRTIAKGLVL